MLAYFKVNVKDREYQFWERNALSVELKTHSVFMQNWNIYIGILFMEGYAICLKSIINSSARFYETGIHNQRSNLLTLDCIAITLRPCKKEDGYT